MENNSFKVYIEENSQNYGRLYIEPLERGYGDTLGNALRRLLLSSIRGAAVTAVKIDGILHEFSTIPGIREDVIEILMNLKHIPVRAKAAKSEIEVNDEGFKIITLDTSELPKDFFTRSENPGVITAKDMPWDSDYEFCGDGVLCSLEENAHLLMEIYVEQGVGYLSAERERPSQPALPVDAILTDAIFSPVRRVNYQVEPARVEQSIDYDRLVLEVWTNGAITPEDAVSEASRIAESYFGSIAATVGTAPHVQREIEPEIVEEPVVEEEEKADENEHYDHPIHELELSIRSENCLLRGGIHTVGDLLRKSRDDLLKIRNLGKISLTEIEKRLDFLGYELSPSSEVPSTDSEAEADSDSDSDLADTDSEGENESDDVSATETGESDSDKADEAVKEDKEAEEVEEAEEVKEVKEAKEAKGGKKGKKAKEAKEVKEASEPEKPEKPAKAAKTAKTKKKEKPEKTEQENQEVKE